MDDSFNEILICYVKNEFDHLFLETRWILKASVMIKFMVEINLLSHLFFISY